MICELGCVNFRNSGVSETDNNILKTEEKNDGQDEDLEGDGA